MRFVTSLSLVVIALAGCESSQTRAPEAPAPRGIAPRQPTAASELRASYVRAVQTDAPAEYDFLARADHARAKNSAHNLEVELGTDGLWLSPEDREHKEWWLELSLGASGRANKRSMREPAADKPASFFGNRSGITRTVATPAQTPVEEWYLNGPLGVEQGFTVAAAPPGKGPLSIEVAVGGLLEPELSDDGTTIALKDARGRDVLYYSDLAAYDAQHRPLPAWMAIENANIVLYVDDHGASYPVEIDPLVWGQSKKIIASDAAANANFGRGVAVAGDLAVINGVSSAYVFERNLGGTNNWGQRKKLVGTGLRVGSISGNTIVMGAPLDATVAADAGAAFVFDRDFGGTDNWGQRKKLTASDAAASDFFGISVSISADTIIVGAYLEDGSGTDRGAAYIFERNLGGTDNWGERSKITASDTADSDYFGQFVGLSADTAIVGAPREDGVGSDYGAAYIYDRNLGGTNAWGERKKLIGNPGNNYHFGSATAIDVDTAVVGAPGEAINEGGVYVFGRNQGGANNWGLTKRVVSSATGGTLLGYALSISGDRVIAGAPADSYNFTGDGSATIFERNQGGTDNWGEIQVISGGDVAGGDEFGVSVAVSGDTVMGGADGVSGGVGPSFGDAAGAAYVFSGLLTLGSPCASSPACGSGFCADGVCCNSACGANSANDCQACSVAAGAVTDGTCAPVSNGTVCNDGTFCNGSETCTGGVCGSSSGDPCVANVGDADSDCSESCDETADTCTANDPNTSACSDGNFCNGTETCTGGTCGSSTGDPCAANVGDADSDCSESCNEATDSCTANDPNTSACSDGLYCDGSETCTNGVCGSSTGDPCAANVGDADSDCSESCNEANDTCTANDPNTSACSDGLYCDGNETCTNGVCGSSSGDPCAVNVGDADSDCSESCNEATDNCTANDPNTSACSDGVFCNGTESCNGGVCGSPSGDPCVANVGDADNDCSESCNEAMASCTANDPNGSACSDGLYCTGTETCTGGVCGSSTGDPCAANLGDADSDCSESCNEAADNCTATDAETSPCDDGLFCTLSDACVSGSCVGVGTPCPGPDGDGNCSESCDETSDSCGAADPNGSACDDGLYCTVDDACTGGVCGGQARSCALSCLDGACDENTDACGGSPSPDGAACSTEAGAAGTCAAGVCEATQTHTKGKDTNVDGGCSCQSGVGPQAIYLAIAGIAMLRRRRNTRV